MKNLDSLIKQASHWLQHSRYTIALTGAGISTPSGIPDFRSAGSGLWEQVDPMKVASIYGFRQHPKAFYDWIHPLAQLIWHARPNPAHMALAQMEADGPLKSIITQNIDALHTQAGSKTVYEVHGHLRQATCQTCEQVFDTAVIWPNFIATAQMPCCTLCGGVLKPNVILFGEVLPIKILHQAQLEAKKCDVMLVAGSSLEVAPAGDLPLLAKQAGARLILVNLSETHVDDFADVVIHADVAEVLPQLASTFANSY